MQKFDFKTLEYTVKKATFNPSDFKNADGTMKNPDSDELKQFGRSSGTNIKVWHDSSQPDTFLAEGLGPRASGTLPYMARVAYYFMFLVTQSYLRDR
jgi:hypothetical protein